MKKGENSNRTKVTGLRPKTNPKKSIERWLSRDLVAENTDRADYVSMIDLLDAYGIEFYEDFDVQQNEELITEEAKWSDITDEMIVSGVDEICQKVGLTRAQFLKFIEVPDNFEREALGAAIRTGMDGSSIYELRSQSGNRVRRATSDFMDPSKPPSSEVNRRDKKLVGFIPRTLSFEFGKVRKALKFPSVKSAFEQALAEWLDAGCSIEPYKIEKRLLCDEKLEFQVRVDFDVYRVLALAAASFGKTKRDCIEEVMMRFVQASLAMD